MTVSFLLMTSLKKQWRPNIFLLCFNRDGCQMKDEWTSVVKEAKDLREPYSQEVSR
jgi:hypothetical protein